MEMKDNINHNDIGSMSGKSEKVSVIPATKRAVQAGGQIKCVNQLRVAAYCRVSTGDESQQTSYTKQKSYYTDFINRKEGWTMAGIFADEGISGTSTRRRAQFQKMMEAAMEGKIDYIVTKSISRFARNTVDTLSCVRQLQELNPPVGVYFEKENIDTLDAKGELILTILSALAQDESRSISDNIKWTLQKNFKSGKAHLNPNRIFGYRSDSNGNWEIHPEQAEVVRFIFKSYLAGKSATRIAEELNNQGHRTGLGKLWRCDSVLYVLRNEKYVGDCEMQKYVTESYLTHKSVINEGQAPRIYFTDHHIPIIDRETWDKTRAIMEMHHIRRIMSDNLLSRTSGKRFSAFGNLECGSCGGKMVKRSYNSVLKGYSDERSNDFNPETETEIYHLGYGVWRCENTIRKRTQDKNDYCDEPAIMEFTLQQSFMEMLYRVRKDYDSKGPDSHLMRMFQRAKEQKKCTDREYQYIRNKINEHKSEIERLMKEREEINERKNNLKIYPSDDDLVSEFSEINSDYISIDSDYISMDNYNDAEDMESVYSGLISEIDHRIEAERKTVAELEKNNDAVLTMEKSFHIFIQCLEGLPKTNKAGQKLNINTIDTQGSLLRTLNGEPVRGKLGDLNRKKITITPDKIDEALDLLIFDERIYMAFFESGVVEGDRIILRTTFGVEMVMDNIHRPLVGFLGFRRCMEDGSVEFISQRYQITERKIGYSRRKKD